MSDTVRRKRPPGHVTIWWKLVVAVVTVVALGAVAMVGYRRSKEAQQNVVVPVIKPQVVRTAPLQTVSYTVTESFYGRISANAELNMSFQIVGRLATLGRHEDQVLKENELVQKGDLIATLELARFEAAEAQARAMQKESDAERSAADAQVQQLVAQFEDADREYKRQLELQGQKAAVQREVDRAHTAMRVAKAQLDAANARLQRAQATYESAKAALDVAQVNVRDAKLFAPITGRVASVPFEIGAMVRPGDVVMRLVDLTKVKLVIGVVERKLAQLSEGQRVRIEVQAIQQDARATGGVGSEARAWFGVVRVVPPAANPVTGLFDVEVEIDNKDGSLKPGMIGKAVVSLRENTQVVSIPAEAVRRRGDKIVGYFVTEGFPVGLDLGAIGNAKLDTPTTVVREIVFENAILENDHYLVFNVPQNIRQIVVEGQTRVADGKPVTVVGGEPVFAAPSITSAEPDAIPGVAPRVRTDP